MVNPLDPRRLRADATLDIAATAIHTTGPRDVDPDVLASAHLDYGELASRFGATAAVSQLSSVASPSAAAQAQLDAYRAAFTAAYDVGGTTVRVAPQFRMVGGHNDANAGYARGGFDVNSSAQVKELLSICTRSHLGGAIHCLMGCPTASELTSVTRALIEAGKLPTTGGNVDLQSRIKSMQWQWGIGIDCTDYVLGAALRASGKTSSSVTFGVLPQPGVDYFQSVDTNPHLRKTSVAAAHPGDVFVLDSPGDVGHRAVVYSNTACDAATLSALASRSGAGVTAFATGGPVRMLEVDASWSAGPSGASWGGVRRDTWLFNESTRQWAQINVRVTPPAQPAFEVTPNGPANDVFHGVYRFQ